MKGIKELRKDMDLWQEQFDNTIVYPDAIEEYYAPRLKRSRGYTPKFRELR